MPGFLELTIFDAHDGSTGNLEGFGRGGVTKCRRPVDASQIGFGQGHERSNAEIGELGAEVVVETEEFFGAVEMIGAVVENGVGRKKFNDGFAAALVPDFFKPADNELFVVFESGDGVRSGRHEVPPEETFPEYNEMGCVQEDASKQGGDRIV